MRASSSELLSTELTGAILMGTSVETVFMATPL
jgi:hypothetical protein